MIVVEEHASVFIRRDDRKHKQVSRSRAGRRFRVGHLGGVAGGTGDPVQNVWRGTLI